ncbi:hypothetical protein OG866_02100 [Streptomyces sp. NBC_00663]|uniref:hypothetical protein n=1 Tax=Streptomyces sp. NBC_00663 TaxID=2975801 RepID=UPI002E2EC116|nr:hypothetical protein [Streptomyces sp. NBC_00663]
MNRESARAATVSRDPSQKIQVKPLSRENAVPSTTVLSAARMAYTPAATRAPNRLMSMFSMPLPRPCSSRETTPTTSAGAPATTMPAPTSAMQEVTMSWSSLPW